MEEKKIRSAGIAAVAAGVMAGAASLVSPLTLRKDDVVPGGSGRNKRHRSRKARSPGTKSAWGRCCRKQFRAMERAEGSGMPPRVQDLMHGQWKAPLFIKAFYIQEWADMMEAGQWYFVHGKRRDIVIHESNRAEYAKTKDRHLLHKLRQKVAA